MNAIALVIQAHPAALLLGLSGLITLASYLGLGRDRYNR